MNQSVENARKAYWAGDWDNARAHCNKVLDDNSIGVAALLSATIAEIAALAFEFLDHETADKAHAGLVACEPENLDHRNQYAAILARAGQFERAEEQLRQALAIDKSHANSYFNLSLIHKAGADDPIIGSLEEFLRAPDLPPADQYAYRLSLGKFYDDIGEFDRAFAHYDAAMRSPGISYDHGAQKTFFDKIKTTFSKALFESHKGAGDPSFAPIFFVGMPRSGSSLLETLLARDTRIASIGERIEMSIIVETIARRSSSNNYLENIARMDVGAFQAYGADYCRRLAPPSRGAERFIDKNLLNFQRAGLIDLILPNATIVHMRRDPVDICLSCYFQTLDPAIFPFTFDLAHIGQYYGLYADMMSHWDETMPGRLVEADYERLINDPEFVIGALTEETGLTPMPETTPEGVGDKTIIATASAWQARQPVYETSVRRWMNYEKHLGPLIAALEDAGVSLAGAD